MKFRLTLLVLFLSFFLAACSLAEDITPPPGYQSPTSVPTLNPATDTPRPTSTLEPATATPETPAVETSQATPSIQGSVTPSAEVSPTLAAAAVTVSGKVTNSAGKSLPGDLKASLYLYNTSTGNVDQSFTSPIQSDGTYQFVGVQSGSALAYFVTVNYSGVTYSSSPAAYDQTVMTYNLPVAVYEATNNLNILTISQVHMSFDFSTNGKVQVQALYVVNNPGTESVVVQSDGTSIPFIQLPAGATQVQFSLAQGSAPLMTATNGFALIPGADKQYGIFIQFSLPYTRSLKLVQPFKLPVSTETIIVPEGVRVRSEQLKDNGTQAYQGNTYHLYQGNSLVAGSTLTFTISGKPGAPTGFTFDRQTIILISVGVVGILMIGVGVYLFLRDRALNKKEEEEEAVEDDDKVEGDALGTDPDSITDAIIALDNSYKAGDLSKEAYEKRRAELKQRLKETL